MDENGDNTTATATGYRLLATGYWLPATSDMAIDTAFIDGPIDDNDDGDGELNYMNRHTTRRWN